MGRLAHGKTYIYISMKILYCLAVLFIIIFMVIFLKIEKMKSYSINYHLNYGSNYPYTVDNGYFVSGQSREFFSNSTDFYFSRLYGKKEIQPSRAPERFTYSEKYFRSLDSVPVIWIDSEGHTRWNEAAEREMYKYLLEKQTIKTSSIDDIVSECMSRQILLINQHEAGFYSRFNCFIDQFGQTLYSPSMAVLSYRPFHVSGSGKEDFRGEGIIRYFEPMSTCALFERHPKMAAFLEGLKGNTNSVFTVGSVEDLLYENQRRLKVKYIRLFDMWAYGYEQVPYRRWLFSTDRPLTPVNFSLPISELLNHSHEHIYHSPSWTESMLAQWNAYNRPYGDSTQHLAGPSYTLTWQDRVFTSFLRYIFVLYFHKFPDRIYKVKNLLFEHWSTYLHEKYQQTLDDMAAIFVRRGDKMPEDAFWLKHKYWRNLSLYVKTLVEAEKEQNRYFRSVFVMTDDTSVMDSFRDYADDNSKGIDEPYARKHLKGRNILFNVFAPQACFNPFIRIGFDQFLVSLEFIIEYSQFTVSHTDSNVGRYLEFIIYARRQFNDSTRLRSFIKNAADEL